MRLNSQNLTGDGDPERVVVARVSQSFQPMLGATGGGPMVSASRRTRRIEGPSSS